MNTNADTQSDYWFLKHIFFISKKTPDSFFLNFILKFHLKKNYIFRFQNFIIKNNQKFGIRFSKKEYPSLYKNLYKNFFSTNIKNSNFKKNIFRISEEKFFYNSNFQSSKQIAKSNLFDLLRNLAQIDYFKNPNASLWVLFDINFLKKEKIYTKLKYSRVPQYDIVSGGVAALFAGFLGFLICEKFGFELLDSGDFYVLFMYVVFFCFFLKTVLNICTLRNTNWSIGSPKWFFSFYKNLILLFFNFLVNFFLK